MNEYYILDGHKTKKTDMETWAKGFNENRKVARNSIGDVTISTGFLGMNHNWEKGNPILFETMVFGGKLDQEMDRYSTWEEAKIGHKTMVEKVKRSK